MAPRIESKTRPAIRQTDDMTIDMSKMNDGQRAALEVAEHARDQSDNRESFASLLLSGNYTPALIAPFPMQDAEERAIGDVLVTQVTEFLLKHLDPEAADATRTIPAKVIEGLRDLGIFRMKVPTEYGGMGLSQVNYNRVMLAIASYCGSTAVLVSAHQSIGVPQPLKMFGTEDQKAKYLTQISKGALSAFALTEPEVGSDPAKMTTTAELSKDGKYYILNGDKLWTTNGPIADLIVVMARTAPKIVNGRERKQITAFIVEANTKGVETVSRCDFMGLRAIHNGLMRFHNVKVPIENVLWGEGLGLKLALKTLNTGRLTLPAACAGIGKQCISIMRQWGNEREQWGHPIGRHEVGAQKIAFATASTFAMEAVTWLTSHWADEDRDIRIEAAMAKLFCSEVSWTIIDQTMQLRGGRGYERGSSLRERGEPGIPVERMMRDGRINTIIEGTSEIMRLFLAREALDAHLKRAKDLLRPGNSVGVKAKAAVGLAGFYGHWYPRQLIGQWVPHPMSGGTPGGRRLARHERYIHRTSHRLAAAMFGAMLRHGPKLERRQVVLGRFMDVGTELFAMSATCAYARSIPFTRSAIGDPQDLADLFCRQARERINATLARRDGGTVRQANDLAGQVLDGAFRWMEEGIIPVE